MMQVASRGLNSGRGRQASQSQRRQEAEVTVTMEEVPQAESCRWLLEAGTGKEMVSPRAPRKNTVLPSLDVAQWDPFQTSDFQNWRILNVCCF